MSLTVSHSPIPTAPNMTVEFTADKIELIKNTICKNSTDEELQLFLHACKRTGLDPFMKQIHAVKRRTMDNGTWKETITIQTGIDGYRLIADRTGRYCPGREPTYTYDKDGRLFSATAYVKKQTSDGTWHEVSASAFYSEYCQKNGKGEPTKFWLQMGHVMLAKVAESLCLRKSFPAELSGIYTQEEMQQSEKEDKALPAELTTQEIAEYITSWVSDRGVKYEDFEEYMKVMIETRKWTWRICRDMFDKNRDYTKGLFDKWLATKNATSQEEPKVSAE